MTNIKCQIIIKLLLINRELTKYILLSALSIY